MASPVFVSSFLGMGGPSFECICGRTHFVVERGGYTWEHGEHERLMALSANEPDTYIRHENIDAVVAIEFDGVPVVDGCPCKFATRLEMWLSEMLPEVLKFYRARAQALVDQGGTAAPPSWALRMLEALDAAEVEDVFVREARQGLTPV